ncbi:glycosyltransferase [Hymenobacter sp. DH14]|uniref:Glycosyltransferase n=1 Tax=Hymenobacter cyanobacteriorum TaxID=2926463 RepID=A0A9X1VGE1_9BACT|nr:glycosyltransferase [Hymenobacter cyanobacteriorum]MCI1187653.1 glycosyltransferase [Hymenobacter cyanobacteriorum]
MDDTRMRGKFAETLAGRAGTRVHVAGRQSSGTGNGQANIALHPIFNGRRLSLGRLAAQWRYWRLLQRLKPDLAIVHAPELLPLTLLWQALGRGRKFLYDIRENYALNVSTQHVYQGLTRRWLAAGLRWVEGRAAHQAAGVMLAEASYAEELPFLEKLPPDRVVVLENKYQPAPGEMQPNQPRPHPMLHEPLRLLYSGTISELNGIWEAVALTQALATTWPGGAHCTIIGFCQQPELLRQLAETVARQPGLFTLIGGAVPVPHAAIVAAIGRSHLGLLPYRPHPSTARCRPTKLFEYLALGLPILIPRNWLWAKTMSRHGGGLMLELTPADAAAAHLRQGLERCRFYPNGIPEDVLWASEGKKLWHLLDTVI